MLKAIIARVEVGLLKFAEAVLVRAHQKAEAVKPTVDSGLEHFDALVNHLHDVAHIHEVQAQSLLSAAAEATSKASAYQVEVARARKLAGKIEDFFFGVDSDDDAGVDVELAPAGEAPAVAAPVAAPVESSSNDGAGSSTPAA